MKIQETSEHARRAEEMTKEELLVADAMNSIINYVNQHVTDKDQAKKVEEYITREYLEIRPSLNGSKTPAYKINDFKDYLTKERDDLTLGYLTDLEMANAVFMNGDMALPGHRFRMPMSPIMFLTAAKERIRWLGIHLEESKKAIKELKEKVISLTPSKSMVVGLGHPRACGEAVSPAEKQDPKILTAAYVSNYASGGPGGAGSSETDNSELTTSGFMELKDKNGAIIGAACISNGAGKNVGAKGGDMPPIDLSGYQHYLKN